MTKNKHTSEPKEKQACQVHVMPPIITDSDISALLNGVLSVIKKKVELDMQAQIINLNVATSKIEQELKNKCAECVRLKNEILFLKSELNKTNN